MNFAVVVFRYLLMIAGVLLLSHGRWGFNDWDKFLAVVLIHGAAWAGGGAAMRNRLGGSQ